MSVYVHWSVIPSLKHHCQMFVTYATAKCLAWSRFNRTWRQSIYM